MVSYIQYKQFRNIDELNEWLEDFRAPETDNENIQFIAHDENTIEFRTLLNVQFIQESSIAGNASRIDGTSHIYPIARFKVTKLGK